ncbi:MAG: RNA pseudouridine synthase [Phycisphaeraceae bacterium]
MPTTLHKPAGLPVFPPHDDPAGDCLLARLLRDQPWRRDIAWPQGFAGGIAHRLDNATSGAVLIADTLDELNQLRRWFAEHRLTKRYLLLAAKDVAWDDNVCDKPIAHHPRRRNRMVVQRGQNTPHRGKWYPAQTHFVRLRGRLFQATIHSGVMHQIRVHAAFVGIPIQGDPLYGGGDAPEDAPAGVTVYLHHQGMTGPDGFMTDRVPDPAWIQLAG